MGMQDNHVERISKTELIGLAEGMSFNARTLNRGVDIWFKGDTKKGIDVCEIYIIKALELVKDFLDNEPPF